jgi:hypothetical protein
VREQAPTLTTARIIWGALLASLGIYVALLVTGFGGPRPEEGPEPVMITALSAVAMFNSLASLLFPRYLLRQGLASSRDRLRELVGQPPEVIGQRAMTLGFAPMIIGLALAESVAIFGLILGLLGAPLLTVAPFFAAGAMLMLVQFPTMGRFRGPLDEALATLR